MRRKLISISGSFIAILAVLTFNHCKKSHDDPCEGKAETNASFTGVVKGWNRDMEMKDTVASQNVFLFTPTQKFDSYKWKIGSDTNTWTSPEFQINIGHHTGTIPVTLIGKRTPDLKCFPDDDGVDTFTKNMVVVDPKESKVLGKWHGALQSNPLDTFTVLIFVSDTDFNEPFLVDKGEFYFTNLPKGFTRWERFYPQYTSLMLEEMPSLDAACMCAAGLIYGRLLDYNSIEIEFTGWDKKTKSYVSQKFIGTRK